MATFTSCSDDDNADVVAEPRVELYTASNTSGKVSVINLAGNEVKRFNIESNDADGVYYDANANQLMVASRSNNRLEVYGNVQLAMQNNESSLPLHGTSPVPDFSNARETAVSGDYVFVVEDEAASNNFTNKIIVYRRDLTTFTVHRVFTLPFKTWGIHADGADLYAVVDNTSDIVKFTEILAQPTGLLQPSKRVTIEGLTRTHGITYSPSDDVMVLTDIGLATNDTDGGLIVIENFDTEFDDVLNGGTIIITRQKRVYGANTQMGNPVDVAYDNVTRRIYVAERANGNGKVLTFDFPTQMSADVAPVNSRAEEGVSSVYLSRR